MALGMANASRARAAMGQGCGDPPSALISLSRRPHAMAGAGEENQEENRGARGAGLTWFGSPGPRRGSSRKEAQPCWVCGLWVKAVLSRPGGEQGKN